MPCVVPKSKRGGTRSVCRPARCCRAAGIAWMAADSDPASAMGLRLRTGFSLLVDGGGGGGAAEEEAAEEEAAEEQAAAEELLLGFI